MGDTNIWTAAGDGDLLKVKFFIDTGAYGVNQVDDNGYSPLSAAISYNHLQVAKFLIEKGADVNLESDNGLVALFYAETVESAKILIENGANIHVLDRRHRNVLDHIMDEEECEDLIEYYESLGLISTDIPEESDYYEEESYEDEEEPNEDEE